MTTRELLVVAVFVVLAVLAAFGLGWWARAGRAADDLGDLEEELERAIARHPAGKHRPLPVAGRLELLAAPVETCHGHEAQRHMAVWPPSSPVRAADRESADRWREPKMCKCPGCDEQSCGLPDCDECDADQEPTEVIGPSDWSVTAWTQQQGEDMARWLAALIGGTDEVLREITR